MYSSDSLFRADIEMIPRDSSSKEWENEWIINVYESESDSNIWTSIFYHDGYGGGELSDDGGVYACANWWLYMEYQHLVAIYTPDTVYSYSGNDFGLNEAFYPNTVSHKIWMEKYYLNPANNSDSTLLIIETLDSKRIEIDFKQTKISTSKISLSKKELQDLKLIKQLALWTTIVIGIGVLLFTFLMIHFRKKQ